MKPRPDLDPTSLTGRIATLDERGALAEVRRRVAAGGDAMAIIADCQLGMRYVGEDYQSGEYFISGLIMAGEIFREAMEILDPLLPAAAADAAATSEGTAASERGASILVCTVRGDIHDIGKSILVTLLRSHGFTVHDLGVDVPAAEVARKTLELHPDAVGLSGLLMAAHRSMKETVAGLRRIAPQLSHPPGINGGGGAVDEQVRDWSGADLWAPDAVSGVQLIRQRVQR